MFERGKSDVEDHPLLVEVQIEESKLKQTECFWVCDRTIYLSPITTRFLFFSESDKTISLSMSDSSSETKLMRLYTNRINVIEKPNESYKSITTSEPCLLNETEMHNDFIINKMKGLLYGYYIGAMLSTDLDSVKYLNTLKEIHNIFAAILSSFDKQPTAYQNDRLDELFKSLRCKNKDYLQLLEIIGDVEKTDKVLCLDFVQPRGLSRKMDFLYYLQAEQNETEKENHSITWIKSKIEETKRSIVQNSQLLQPDKGEIVVLDNSVSILNNETILDKIEKELCLSWFNKTLSSEETNGKISTYRAKLADDITDEAISVLGDNWKESNIRTYLNALRHHIAGEEFNQEWNNGLLSSISAVILAGEDWEKLLSFMQNKEMTDYKLAYAFYGELNGFANLTRDFTDLIYNCKGDYVRNVYTEIYGQLFGVKLEYNIGEERNNVADTSKERDSSLDKELDEERSNFENEDNNRSAYKKNSIKNLKSNKQSNTEKTITIQQDNVLFPLQQINPIGGYFFNDKNFWFYIEPLITDNKTKKSIKKDLEWFQDEFSKPIGSRGYIYNNINEFDNKAVIEKFSTFKMGKDKKGKIQAPYFTTELRTKIKEKLMELYKV